MIYSNSCIWYIDICSGYAASSMEMIDVEPPLRTGCTYSSHHTRTSLRMRFEADSVLRFDSVLKYTKLTLSLYIPLKQSSPNIMTSWWSACRSTVAHPIYIYSILNSNVFCIFCTIFVSPFSVLGDLVVLVNFNMHIIYCVEALPRQKTLKRVIL